jgi:hypothetical protein
VKYITSTGRLYYWSNAFQQLNNGLFIMGGISRYGVEGELLNVPVNIFRNDLDYVVSMTTQERVDWEPAAVEYRLSRARRSARSLRACSSTTRSISISTTWARSRRATYSASVKRTFWNSGTSFGGDDPHMTDPETKDLN